jgi:hypothetical protein
MSDYYVLAVNIDLLTADTFTASSTDVKCKGIK